MWPVIIRELRAGSRQWGTYWLRVLAAAFAIGAFVLFMEQGRGMRTGREGAELFSTMHRILLATIAVVVPLMTSDCISRERREGTLGLLFLTNLTAREIILAKAIAHGLRACALWAAVLPLMALPILLGGVDWREVVLSSCYSLEFIGLNLVVGLVASAFTRSQAGAICASCGNDTASKWSPRFMNSMWSSVTCVVSGNPRTTMPSESPTSRMSTPLSSSKRAVG